MNKESLSMRSRSARRGPVRLGAAILVTGGVALVGACSSASGNAGGTSTPASTPMTHSASPSTSVSASAATCQHVSSLKTSLDSLTHLQLNASAASQIRKDLTNIQTQLTAIRASGNGALSTQVSALSSSLGQVQNAAKNLSSPPSASQVTSIISALSALKNNSKATLDSMKSACPNV
ncbi:MAG: hypothetical protein ACR2FU_24210 [Streptosporangiaceae bacterium]